MGTVADAGKTDTKAGESPHLPAPAVYHERGRCGCEGEFSFERMVNKGNLFPEAGMSAHLPAPAMYHERRRPGCKRGCPLGRRDCCNFFRCLYFLILVVLLYLLVWTVVQPTAPRFDIENLHISGLNASSSPIIAKTTFVMTVCNPNKIRSIHYDDIDVSVEAYGFSIGEGNIPSFHQGYKNTTFLSGNIGPTGVKVDSDTAALLITDRTRVQLLVKVEVQGRFTVGKATSHNLQMTVRCVLTADLTRSSGSQLTYKLCPS